jgi:hypothetical protein
VADDSDGSLYELTFEEAKRSVMQQAGALEALRSRAGHAAGRGLTGNLVPRWARAPG